MGRTILCLLEDLIPRIFVFVYLRKVLQVTGNTKLMIQNSMEPNAANETNETNETGVLGKEI